MISVFELLVGTPDGVFAVDRQQRIAFWNDGARRILGFEPAEVLARPCYRVFGGLDEDGCIVCERRCGTFSASLRGELSPTRDVSVRTRDAGRKRVSVTTFVLPSRWHELSLLTHVFRDASEGMRVEPQWEKALRQTQAESTPEGSPHPVEQLTQREMEVLRLLASGASTSAICARLDINLTTVRTHVRHVLAKLAVHSRLEAVASATRNGLLRSDDD